MTRLRKIIKETPSTDELRWAVLGLSFSKERNDRNLVERAFLENVRCSRFAFACARQGNGAVVRKHWRPEKLPADPYGFAIANLVDGLDLSEFRDEVVARGRRKPRTLLAWSLLKQSFEGIGSVPKDIRKLSEFDGSVAAWVDWNSHIDRVLLPNFAGHHQSLCEQVLSDDPETRFCAFLACVRSNQLRGDVLNVLVRDRLFLTEEQFGLYEKLSTAYRLYDATIRSQTSFGVLNASSFQGRVSGLRTGNKPDLDALRLFEGRLNTIPPAEFDELLEQVAQTARHDIAETTIERWLAKLDYNAPETRAWAKAVFKDRWAAAEVVRLMKGWVESSGYSSPSDSA